MEEKVRELLDRYLKEEASDQERAIVESWYLTQKHNQAHIDDDMLMLAQHQSMAELRNHIKHPVRKKRKMLAWACLIVIPVCLLFLISDMTKRGQRAAGIASHQSADMPGNGGATLTLGNGQRISLNNSQIGRVAVQGAVAVTKTANGQIVYDASGGGSTGADASSLNTLSTSAGQSYLLVLPDKSKVWINAGSSLAYTSSLLVGNERRVTLRGEAYFEVAKDAIHPFIVTTDDQEIKVLGTHFNVNAHDQKGSITTLLEGKVALRNQRLKTQAPLVLSPGQKSVWNNAKISVALADTAESVAWKNGYFQFNESDLPTIMNSIARWYDVDVVFQHEPSTEAYHLRFSRNQRLTDLIAVFSTYGITLQLEGRRLIVKE